MTKIITVPFGWLLGQLYHLTGNYGIAMIIFALAVQTVLLPIRAKSKKSMMKMSRLQPRVQDIQRRYPNDQQKQNELVQKLYQDEGASMGLGCLWSFVPILILFPLFNVIREPITYILGDGENAAKIVEVIKGLEPSLFNAKMRTYDQVFAAQAIAKYATELQAQIPGISAETLAGINFDFFGINLGAIPQFNIFSAAWVWNWANIGLFLIPVVSAGSQVLDQPEDEQFRHHQ